MEKISQSQEETKEIAAEFAHTLRGGEVVFLRGDLGSGKTTFVQGLAKALGYDEPVRSPTFALVNVYPLAHETISRIVHVDLYRLDHVSELGPLALEEYQDDQTVLLVEWPEILKNTRIIPTTSIHFQTDQTGKKIRLEHVQTV